LCFSSYKSWTSFLRLDSLTVETYKLFWKVANYFFSKSTYDRLLRRSALN
jgi:hypothetical protein